MLSIEDPGTADIHIVADGQLDSSEYDAFVPAFERLARVKSLPVPMLIELGPQFSGWSFSGLGKS